MFLYLSTNAREKFQKDTTKFSKVKIGENHLWTTSYFVRTTDLIKSLSKKYDKFGDFQLAFYALFQSMDLQFIVVEYVR